LISGDNVFLGNNDLLPLKNLRSLTKFSLDNWGVCNLQPIPISISISNASFVSRPSLSPSNPSFVLWITILRRKAPP
jgi:hypothetical protein